jgi:hypothetical protein
VAVLFIIKASTLGMLHRRPLTSMFLMCFPITWSHLIPSILQIAPWWKLLSLSRLLLVRFQVSQPHRRAFRGPTVYIWHLIFLLTSLLLKKVFAAPIIGLVYFYSSFNFHVFIQKGSYNRSKVLKAMYKMNLLIIQ